MFRYELVEYETFAGYIMSYLTRPKNIRAFREHFRAVTQSLMNEVLPFSKVQQIEIVTKELKKCIELDKIILDKF